MNKTALYQSKVNGLLVSGPNNLCGKALCETFDGLPDDGPVQQLLWANENVSFCFALDATGAVRSGSEELDPVGVVPDTVEPFRLFSIEGGDLLMILPVGIDFTTMDTTITGDGVGFPYTGSLISDGGGAWHSNSLPAMDANASYCITFATTPVE